MTNLRSFTAIVRNGVITDSLRLHIADFIAKFDGKQIKITIQEEKPKRTIPQNKFFHACIIPAVRDWLRDEHGVVLSLDEAKEWIIKRVWKYTDYKTLPDGEPYEVRKSSTEPDINLWMEFSEITYAFFAERGLILPSPQKPLPKHITEPEYEEQKKQG